MFSPPAQPFQFIDMLTLSTLRVLHFVTALRVTVAVRDNNLKVSAPEECRKQIDQPPAGLPEE